VLPSIGVISSPAFYIPAVLALATVGLTVALIRERGRRREIEKELADSRAHQNELRSRLNLTDAVFANSPDAIVVMDPHDPKVPMRIVACNDYACRLHGWTREELVGQSIGVLETDMAPWSPERVRRLIELTQSGTNRGELTHVRRDGSRFPIEYSNSLFKVDGREYLLGFDRDITAYVAAATALRESETRFRVIIEACPMAINLMDPYDREAPMRILDANRRSAEIHEVPLADFIGHSLGDYTPNPISFEEAQAKLAELRLSGTIQGEGFHRTAMGRVFPIEFRYVIVVIEGRELILGIDQDVSARKRMDKELSESRRLRAVGEMVAGVAHEFNNLLTPISMYVDMADDPAARAVKRAVQQACDLTKRILTFGRRPDGTTAACDVVQTTEECVELFRPTIDRRIYIKHELGQRCGVRIRREDLCQIIINLLLNARDTLVDRMQQPAAEGWIPSITLTVATMAARPGQSADGTGYWVRLRVTDTGMGMSPVVRERVFEPFFTAKRTGKGTGLGMATTWHLLQAWDGAVELESAEGMGTTFDIYLRAAPLGIEAPATSSTSGETGGPSAAAESRPALVTGHARSVLLVEDNELVAAAVMPMLIHGGFSVTHFADGAEAHAALVAELGRWDCVLTDLNLPGMQGAVLAKRIREAGYAGRIVAYSGMIDGASRKQLAEAKVYDVLQKPFEMEKLWAALRGA